MPYVAFGTIMATDFCIKGYLIGVLKVMIDQMFVYFSVIMSRVQYCEVCDVLMNGPMPAQQHYESAKHIAKVKKSSMIASVNEFEASSQPSQIGHLPQRDQNDTQQKITNINCLASQSNRQDFKLSNN